jgi:uncharacterized protein
MTNQEIVQKTADFVKGKQLGEDSGHGWEHSEAVWNNAKEIGKNETGTNMLVVELAALLHDINDWKLKDLNDEDSANMADKWLKRIGVDDKTIEEVLEIIKKVSYFGPNFVEEEMPIEGKIVRDADRLEAMGAAGWERTAQFGKAKNLPDINEYLPNLRLSDEEYKNYRRKENSSVNHVFEKLLLLKNRLVTKKGQEMGQIKHLNGILGKNLVPDERVKQYIEMLNEARFN